MSYFERSDVLKDGREAVFSKEKKVKGLFELDSSGTIYRFAIEDDDINLYEDNILGDNFDLEKAMGGVKILNFNKVKTISKGAFESLVSTQDLEFYFEGEQIRIEEGAFGGNFQKLKKIKGLNGRLDLLLHNNCFKNFNDIIKELEFENVDIYLYGDKWSKDNIENLIKHINGGKIHAPEEEGKFKIAEKFKELKDEFLASLSKNMIAAILEGVNDKKDAKALKDTKEISNKRNKDENVVSWDKLNDAIRVVMLGKVVNGMKEKGIIIKAEVDVKKARVSKGKLILTKDCFDKISLIGDGMLDILKGLSDKKHPTSGKLLKNDKKNRDRVKEAVKNYIVENWTYVTEELKVEYKVVMDNEELEKLKGLSEEELSKIRQENNIAAVAKVNVESVEDAKKNIGDVMAVVKETGLEKIPLNKEQCIMLRKSYILLGKEYKHKDKKVALQCKKCIEDINEALKKGPEKIENINPDLNGNTDKTLENDSTKKNTREGK